MKYKTSTVVCAIAGGATAFAMTFTPLARADESTFVQDVESHGVPALPITFAVGHQVCADASEYGTAGLDRQATEALNAGVSEHDAAVVIAAAILDLCPSNTPALKAWAATAGA